MHSPTRDGAARGSATTGRPKQRASSRTPSLPPRVGANSAVSVVRLRAAAFEISAAVAAWRPIHFGTRLEQTRPKSLRPACSFVVAHRPGLRPAAWPQKGCGPTGGPQIRIATSARGPHAGGTPALPLPSQYVRPRRRSSLPRRASLSKLRSTPNKPQHPLQIAPRMSRRFAAGPPPETTTISSLGADVSSNTPAIIRNGVSFVHCPGPRGARRRSALGARAGGHARRACTAGTPAGHSNNNLRRRSNPSRPGFGKYVQPAILVAGWLACGVLSASNQHWAKYVPSLRPECAPREHARSACPECLIRVPAQSVR